MTIDYALIRLSLWLSNFRQLDWYAAGALVTPWFAPLGWIRDLIEHPVFGIYAYVIGIPFTMLVTLLAVVLIVATILVSGVLEVLAALAVPALAHVMALAWTIWHALGGRV